jgi:hypothetical protein
MKKIKKAVKNSPSKKINKRKTGSKLTIYGIEHEFVIIAGGGFVAVVLVLLLFF